ncbi:hypothetical protein EI171_20990 [Bradyrhizobium sp. LCT2]|uniref:hypothetical protein n=1 Tax=Bradyrhizobium sp. LCT2 TaxID=2493093 RepID=UPI0013742A0E|nr:hypothetical protein [Bradyrhizobium sp. LCT2]QHP69545.1 hypothetical protein EI171_20990 [Bradyrhizobium sp. LCT2]
MIDRLANVLYWIACMFAALTASIALLIYFGEGYGRKDGPLVTGTILVLALIIWAVGAAIRYILSGKRSAAPAALGGGPSWEETYAQRIYDALPLSNHVGDMSPEKLRIPLAALPRFNEKALFLRETLCFVALASVANPDTNLRPVLSAYTRLLVRKVEQRGHLADADTLTDYSFKDADHLFQQPVDWAQGWLAEFRSDPGDTFMVGMFADHCLKLFSAYKTAIVNTHRQ